MTRFVISDHHFNHDNIIDYANRPFESVDEMNEYMSERWNHSVGSNDPVLHLGDIAFTTTDVTADQYLSEHHGNPILIPGNHDDQIDAEQFPYMCTEQLIIQHHGYRFLCVHRPENVPDEWTEWVLHGHVHNDSPFIDYNNNKINVSVEKVRYTPVSLPIIVKALKQMNSGDRARTIEDSPITEFEWYRDNFDTN